LRRQRDTRIRTRAIAAEDIEVRCEGAVNALKGWIAALAQCDFAYLERHLANDFVFTVAPMRTAGGTTIVGSKDKAAFI
jgi:hypothetical protein